MRCSVRRSGAGTAHRLVRHSPTPRRCAATALSGLATCRPATVTVPASGFSNPAMSRSSVVFPQPDDPTTAVVVPGRSSRSMSCRTVCPLNDLASPSTSRMAAVYRGHLRRLPEEHQCHRDGEHHKHECIGGGGRKVERAGKRPEPHRQRSRSGRREQQRRGQFRCHSDEYQRRTGSRGGRRQSQRDPQEGGCRRTAQRPRRLFQARRHLGEAGSHVDQRPRDEQQHVREHDQRDALVERASDVDGDCDERQRGNDAGERLVT